MTDKRKVTRRTALGMLAGGAVLTVSGTVAFSDVSGSRSANVDVAEDANAFLSLVGNEDVNEDTVFTNLTNKEMFVELSSTEAGFNATPNPFSLDPGEEQVVDVDGDEAVVTADVSVDLLDGANDVGSIELTRAFETPQMAGIQAVEGSVNNAGQSGLYRFALTNMGTQDVVVDGISIDWTNEPDAAQVGGRGGDDILELEDEGESIVDDVIIVGGDIVDFSRGGPDDTLVLPPEEEIDFRFDRFREAGAGPGSGIGPTDVDITLRAETGATATVELRA